MTITDEQLTAAEVHFRANKVLKAFTTSVNSTSATISVYFHVIQANDTLSGGNITCVSFLTTRCADGWLPGYKAVLILFSRLCVQR